MGRGCTSRVIMNAASLGIIPSETKRTSSKRWSGMKSVVAGYYTSAVIKTDGRLYTTGDNKKGQLGLGRKSIVTTKAGKVIDYKTNF